MSAYSSGELYQSILLRVFRQKLTELFKVFPMMIGGAQREIWGRIHSKKVLWFALIGPDPNTMYLLLVYCGSFSYCNFRRSPYTKRCGAGVHSHIQKYGTYGNNQCATLIVLEMIIFIQLQFQLQQYCTVGGFDATPILWPYRFCTIKHQYFYVSYILNVVLFPNIKETFHLLNAPYSTWLIAQCSLTLAWRSDNIPNFLIC